jgi:hypothetical protein
MKKLSGSYPKRRNLKISKTTPLKGTWNFSMSDDNPLVLDAPRFKIGNGKWRAPADILQIDHAIKDAIGARRRGGQMVQPWARVKSANPAAVEIQLEYRFDVTETPSGPLSLAMERPETFAISINGHDVNPDSECGFWCDKSLRRMNLNPAFLKKGANILKLTCEYDENHSGLEIVYILGAFGVAISENSPLAITKLPETLKTGDWTSQGFPFFSGSMTFTRKVKTSFAKNERVFLALPNYAGVAARILVNGDEVGLIAWEPNEIDITKHIKSGETFDLGIEILGHRRNSHGPLHNPEKWTEWTGPGQFEELTDDITKYNLVPCGLMSDPRILLKK